MFFMRVLPKTQTYRKFESKGLAKGHMQPMLTNYNGFICTGIRKKSILLKINWVTS